MKLSTAWKKVRGLHLGLYFLFALTVSLGSSVSALLETYSLMDVGLIKGEIDHFVTAQAAGREYVPSKALWNRMLNPLGPLNLPIFEKDAPPEGKQNQFKVSHGVGDFYFIFLAVWLWPLYRYRYRGRREEIKRAEKRIIDLPLVMLALVWVAAAQRFAVNTAGYWHIYGPVPPRVVLVFLTSAVMMGTLASYLNMEITGLYIRRFIARPFFIETDPYALREGAAASLSLRNALMLFSLAVVPLIFCLYVVFYFNGDILARLAAAAAKGVAVRPEDVHSLLPLAALLLAVVCILPFQFLSMLLYRLNVQGPVNALVRRMQAVAAGDFGCKTSVLYADELGQLKGHFNRMLDGLQEREHIKDTFGRYVSMEIAEKIMQSGRVNLAGEEIQATVLFSDIRGFTPLSEKLPPAELIRFLNAYFGYVTRPITDNRGVINKFIGDAVMAIFSPVFGVEDHREAALRAAVGMREALKDFNATGAYPPVAFGVGVHSGPLVAGNVGTERRLEYTVLGDTVNVASRIESQTKTAGSQILLSEAALAGVDRSRFPGLAFEACPPVLMKGKSVPMVLYKV